MKFLNGVFVFALVIAGVCLFSYVYEIILAKVVIPLILLALGAGGIYVVYIIVKDPGKK